MNAHTTTNDFSKARLGSAAVQVCPLCETEMGVLLKTRGGKHREYTGQQRRHRRRTL